MITIIKKKIKISKELLSKEVDEEKHIRTSVNINDKQLDDYIKRLNMIYFNSSDSV